jgi:hypothetical protein
MLKIPTASSLTMMNQQTSAFNSQKLKERYPIIHVIVSPPRGSSTAFSRVFWEQPSVRYYSHEPFELTYYESQGLDVVMEKLLSPLDLAPIKNHNTDTTGNNLVIKEMPYQVGPHFPILAALAEPPIIFLIRDPRLNIYSRIQKKLEVGDSPYFPLIETGWVLINQQIQYCKVNQIPYLIADSTDFRNHPTAIFPKIFNQFGLGFSEEMLSWKSCEDVNLDNLEGKHQHLYEKVLRSKGLKTGSEPVPSVDAFPEEHGIRAHVNTCLQIYQTLLGDENRISH